MAATFFSELKRRHVIRLAIVYLIVAWLVIQIASTVFPALEIPVWGFRLVVLIAILGFPIALVLLWGYDLTQQGIVKTPAAAEAEGTQGSAAARPASIAVLPFVNMSDDKDNEYFSDGMTEEIINALTRVQDLQVVARSSAFAFKGKDIDIRDVGRKLGVATVLEGSVRKARSRVRITSQLIDVGSGYHLWSEVYDRELADVFAIQDEIAHAIVDALRVQLDTSIGHAPGSPMLLRAVRRRIRPVSEETGRSSPLVVQSTRDMEAYTLYLRGRFVSNRFTERDTYLSLELFNQALQRDPNFAPAYTGIADSWMQLADDWLDPREAYPKAKDAAVKALALDPDLAEAHSALGLVLGWFEWNFDAAELALRRAVASNPNYAQAYFGLGSVLPPSGRLKEAIAVIRTALTLDPLSATMMRWLARYQLYARNFNAAIDYARQALELDEYHTPAYAVMGSAYLSVGDVDQALAAYQAGARVGNVPFFGAFVARALAAAGKRTEARELVEALRVESQERYIRPEALAEAYTALNDFDSAFELLEQAFNARTATLMYLHIDPAYDPLHGDARFASLMRRIGLRT